MNKQDKLGAKPALEDFRQVQKIVFATCGLFSLLAAIIITAEETFSIDALFGPSVISLLGLWQCRNIGLGHATQLLRRHSKGWGWVSAQASAAAILFSGFLHAGFFGYKHYSGA